MKLSSAEIRAMAGRPDLEMTGRRWRWNWRKAAESLFVAVAVVFVLFVLPLAMFASCTGGR
ncbi:MAG TPA: hypothetical protein PK728_09790 [Bacillota bacterium]|nr:hypothetical protein [Bacillota bacterium]